MFVMTAKVNKRKLLILLAALIALAAAVSLIVSSVKKGAAASGGAVVKDNGQRVAYLRSLGWEVAEEPVDQQSILIPRDFSGVYAEYNKLQKAQGFDLEKYGGMEAMRYTYSVTNHPTGDTSVVADIIVYRNEVVAGDVQSTALDGFMAGLSYPKS